MLETRVDPIIVIGMHRSGTSMITRYLQESGVFMGNKMDENDESKFFQYINRWLLNQFQATWDRPENIENVNSENFIKASEIVGNYLKSYNSIKYLGFNKFLEYKSLFNLDFSWGWKTPLNTLNIKIWNLLYPNAKIIHIYRNPVDVANSLYQREKNLDKQKFEALRPKLWQNKIKLRRVNYLAQSHRCHHIEEGVKLWLSYTQKGLNANSLFENVFEVKYESFLENPELILNDLSNFLQLSIDDEKIKRISNKVDDSRRYAFLTQNNSELNNLYRKYENHDLLTRLGYSNLLK